MLVGEVNVFVVTFGFVVEVKGALEDVSAFGVVLVVIDVLGAVDFLGVKDGFDVNDESLLAIDGLVPTLRITLSNGARSSPLVAGICLLDVRFFRIAMFYPVFFTCEVRPAMLLTGLNFAVLANVLGGATGVVGVAF